MRLLYPNCVCATLCVAFALVGCNNDPKVARQRYVEKGNDYYNHERYKEASIMYRRALQRDLRFGEAWYRLGLTNAKLGLIGEARRDFSRASELEPNNLDAAAQLAEIDLTAFSIDPNAARALKPEAADLIKSMQKKDPHSFDAARLSGMLAALDRDFPKAISDFERANSLKSDQPQVVNMLVQALIANNQPDQAEKYGLHLIQAHKEYAGIYDLMYQFYARQNKPDRAEAILNQKIANLPNQGANLIQLATFYYLTNRKPQMQATLDRLTSNAKSYPNAHQLAGDFYVQLRDYDNAVKQYELGEKEDTKNKRMYEKRLVQVLASQGKVDQAAKVVAALLKEDPKDPETVAIHASLLLQSGNRDQIKTVIGELQPLVAKMGDNPVLHYNLGRAYMAQGDANSIDQARLHLEETLKINPSFAPARLSLAQLQLSRGEGNKAVENASQVLKQDQNNLGAMMVRGMGYLRMGEVDNARAQFNAILKAYPGSNDAHYGLGLVATREKNYAAAEKEFEALRASGDRRGAPSLAQVRVDQQKYDEAIALLKSEQAKDPNSPEVLNRLADVLFASRHWGEAAASYQSLLDKQPGNTEMWLRLGEAKRNSGDSAGATAAFNKAKGVAPGDPKPILEMALLNDSNNQTKEAEKGYEDVLKLQPNNTVALNNLAFHKADEGSDLDQALVYAQRAQQQQPDEVNTQDTLALIYLHKNLTDEGLRLLQVVVGREPNRAMFRVHLAMAYYQKGNKAAAKKELEEARRYNPDSKDQAKIKELMAKVS